MTYDNYCAVSTPASGLRSERGIRDRFQSGAGFQSLAQFIKHVHHTKFTEFGKGIDGLATFIEDNFGVSITAYTLTPVQIGTKWYMSESDGNAITALCIPPPRAAPAPRAPRAPRAAPAANAAAAPVPAAPAAPAIDMEEMMRMMQMLRAATANLDAPEAAPAPVRARRNVRRRPDQNDGDDDNMVV